MKKIIGFFGALFSIALIAIVLVPNSEAGAAIASDNFKIEGGTLVSYNGMDTKVTIPSMVETIGRSAFENNTQMESVVIPSGVKKIEPYAFWGCSNLKSVTFGNDLYEVGDFTFTDCSHLESVILPDSIRRIGIMAFADCPSLKTISLSSYINDIHDTAFDGNKYMTIQAPIGSYAYDYAQKLLKKQSVMEDVVSPIPDSIPTPTPIAEMPDATPVSGDVIGQSSVVGNRVFVFLDDVTVGVGEYQSKYEAEGEHNISNGDVLVHDGVVKEWSYYTNKDLSEVILPDGTRHIEQFSFSRSSLQKITLPEGVECIDYASFYHCDSLTEITIPSSVKTIGDKAFAYTPWLKGFFDGNNPEIGDFLIVGDGILLAYRGKNGIVRIPDNVKTIAGEAFLNHAEILNVIFPEDTVVNVAPTAFLGCTNLNDE